MSDQLQLILDYIELLEFQEEIVFLKLVTDKS